MSYNDPGSEKKYVGLYLASSQKEAWEEYAEENDMSLSRLVRTSVSANIHDEGGSRQGGSVGLSQDQAGKLNSLHRTVVRLGESMEDLRGEVATIRRSVDRPSELTDLEDMTYALLPTVEPGTSEWSDEMSLDGVDTPAEEFSSDSDPGAKDLYEGLREQLESDRERFLNDSTSTVGTVASVAQFLDEKEIMVRAALEQLRDDIAHVHRKTLDDRTYYWREE